MIEINNDGKTPYVKGAGTAHIDIDNGAYLLPIARHRGISFERLVNEILEAYIKDMLCKITEQEAR